MASHIHNFSFNSANPYALAEFWSKITDRPIEEGDKPGDPEVSIDLGNGSNLFFQLDPEPKTERNRLHVCLRPDDRTRDEEVERVLTLGATLFDDRRNPDGTGWAVLRDPEGNEFCVERSEAERASS